MAKRGFSSVRNRRVSGSRTSVRGKGSARKGLARGKSAFGTMVSRKRKPMSSKVLSRRKAA